MTQSQVDPTLYYLEEQGHVIGALVTHTNDFMHCREDFCSEKVTDKLRQKFVAGKMAEREFKYVGFNIIQNPDGVILDQGQYLQKLESIVIKPDRAKQKKKPSGEGDLHLFRGLVGKLNWEAHSTCPDLSFETVEMNSRFKQATVNDLIRANNRANKCILKMKEKPGFIFFPSLGDMKFFRVIVESDAGHANMEDGCSSAGDQLLMLVEEGDKSCVLAWQSNKIKRVVKSTLAAEMLSLSSALDYAIYLRHIILELTGLKEREILITENKIRRYDWLLCGKMKIFF